MNRVRWTRKSRWQNKEGGIDSSSSSRDLLFTMSAIAFRGRCAPLWFLLCSSEFSRIILKVKWLFKRGPGDSRAGLFVREPLDVHPRKYRYHACASSRKILSTNSTLRDPSTFQRFPPSPSVRVLPPPTPENDDNGQRGSLKSIKSTINDHHNRHKLHILHSKPLTLRREIKKKSSSIGDRQIGRERQRGGEKEWNGEIMSYRIQNGRINRDYNDNNNYSKINRLRVIILVVVASILAITNPGNDVLFENVKNQIHRTIHRFLPSSFSPSSSSSQQYRQQHRRITNYGFFSIEERIGSVNILAMNQSWNCPSSASSTYNNYYARSDIETILSSFICDLIGTYNMQLVTCNGME